MPVYYSCHVWHIVVAHLNVKLVADLVQSVMGRKVLSEQSQEFLANVGFDIVTVNGAEVADCRNVKCRSTRFQLRQIKRTIITKEII